MDHKHREAKQIVIVGCAAGYYLSHHPHFRPVLDSITLVEATRIAGGASGKAAGCLAAWADPPCLARESFHLLAELATAHGGEQLWGYRPINAVDCDAVRVHVGDADERTEPQSEADWVAVERLKWYKPPGETAQVHPYLFTTSLARLAQESGVKIIVGKAEKVNVCVQGRKVHSVRVQSTLKAEIDDVPATNVIVAAGPWTGKLLPGVPVGGEKSHSVIIQPPKPISPTILFFDPGNLNEDGDNQLEIYPRPDGTVYLSGQTDYGLPLPSSTMEVQPDLERCRKLLANVELVAPELGRSRTITEQACFRPIVNIKGRDPELGPLLDLTPTKGLILAAGHNQWGIQNAPITGKVISELVFEGRSVSADISQLNPTEHLSSR
ncbi:hypothetical protein CAC42_1502 [Sphaceloma murrayae]|uniref:FAD dependent oxidoreductase domain-containing protein n=1 Tax=Sphaceloma murrayae TaxID=2082308 RepID=A0A2K1R2X1_9PEZI|nr:hypothetical protein CAC42_1502 [Sphaceloma murrayae]